MRKILKLSESDSDDYVEDELAIAGPLLALDINVDVAADGALTVTAKGAYSTSRTADASAKLASKNATTTKNNRKSDGIKAYNVAVDKVWEKYKGNDTHIEALGLHLGKISTDKAECEKIDGGKEKQWIHDGFAVISWKSLGVEADFYTIEECVGDPAIEANWYAANPAQCKEAEAIVKPKTLLVPTWWRITGHNSAGPGVAPSDPFGGKPVH